MKRWLASSALTLGLVGAMATPAAADPPSSGNPQIPVTCNGMTYTIAIIPGRGQFTPALFADSTQLLVPFAFDLTYTDVTTGDSFHDTSVKGAGTNGNVVSCTIDVKLTDPETGHPFTIVGTVLALVTPVR
jgi:hypothetical protein